MQFHEAALQGLLNIEELGLTGRPLHGTLVRWNGRLEGAAGVRADFRCLKGEQCLISE